MAENEHAQPFTPGFILGGMLADRYYSENGTYMDVIRDLRDARIGQDMTQQAVADLIGIGRSSVANAEAGRQIVGGDTLVAWCRVLAVPLRRHIPPGGSDATSGEVRRG